MRIVKQFLFVALVLMLPSVLFAQTVGSITGTVTSDGAPLPGVTVTATSPAMQGARTAMTDANGNYNFTALPPGVYTVKFELSGVQTVTKTVKVALAQTARSNADMKIGMAEAITVTASSPVTAIESTEMSANLPAKLMENLPAGRSLQSAVSLAAGVNTNGPSNGIMISGSPSYESNVVINGVTVNENLRGQPLNLYIEDALQETTVLTGAISAEYGRFTGGVVSAITKSGGNEFSGSFRDALSNAAWTSQSKFDEPKAESKINNVYEATFGGRIIRDRLWFFAAGRDSKTSTQNTLVTVPVVYNTGIKNTRYEGKLTGQITPKHSLVASYLQEKVDTAPYCFLDICMETMSINTGGIQRPKSFKTFSYNGILTNSLMVEANWSQKIHKFSGDGGPVGDFAHASYGYDLNTGTFFGAPVFCKTCGKPEQRNNKAWEAKATYYLATKAAGTHNASAGYQDWAEQRIADNYQSGSGYNMYLYNTPAVDANGVAHPLIDVGDFINFTPILQLTKGSDFATKSIWANDKWDLNRNLSFNIGARYDKNDGKNSTGATTAKDSNVSPRLGVTYDIGGDGRYRVNGSYSKYVARIAETIGGAGSIGGNPIYFQYQYGGPTINADGSLNTVQAFQQVWDWFHAQCADPSNPSSPGCTDIFAGGAVPGVNRAVVGSLKSPSVQESMIGFSAMLGKGYGRVDLMHRAWGDFYTNMVNTSTGKVTDQFGNTFDFQEITNTDQYKRKYDAVDLQAGYPFTTNLNFGATYTYSKLKGNINSETAGSGPVTDVAQQYPEYRNFAQNNPVGYLPADQTHRARIWASYQIPSPIGSFNLSALERVDSGTTYSALTSISDKAYVTNPGYKSPPASVNYYFSDRGAYRWDTVYATDLGVQYELPIQKVHLYAHADLVNAFNQQAQVGGDTTVLSARNSSCIQTVGPNVGARCAAFDPFTETPQLGVNYQFGPNFGKPLGKTSYQTPQTYRFYVGVKF